MRKLLLTVGLLGSAVCEAQGADPLTKAPVPAVAPSCFASVASYFQASAQECPLTWNGITLYGTIDTGGGYQTHGVPFNGAYPNGVEHLISKNSNAPLYSGMPNGLGQSHIGVKGMEPISSDWSFLFNCRPALIPTVCSSPTGRNRWFRTTPTRSTLKARTAIPAAPDNSSTPSLMRA